MKQGTIFFRILIAGFLVVILGYLVSSGLQSFTKDSLLTTFAIEYEAGDTYLASGYLVREEEVLSSSAPITIPAVSEGAKIGVGQTVANCYNSTNAQQQHEQIQALEEQLEQLTYVSSSSTNITDTSALDDNILSNLFAISVHVNRRELNEAADLGSSLRSLVLRRYSDTEELSAISSEIAAISSEMQTLISQSAQSISTITTSRSGHFSGYVDGYESILTPDALRTMTVSDFQKLAEGASADESAFGKMIYGDTWYYVTAIPAEYANTLRLGDSLSVQFIQGLAATISMEVERISDEENGQCVLVLSCDTFLSDITALRQQSVNLVFNSYSGLRVPKAAVRMVDGETGVYILEGTSPKWKPITILGDIGDNYVVENNKESTDNLWPGDEIIVNAAGLEDGKVVE